MIHNEGYLNRSKKEKIYYQSWLPNNQAKGIVVLVHGLGSHSGWYQEMAENIAAADYAVYASDLCGHGKSSGQRGYISSWADYRNNLDFFCQWVKSQSDNQPFFVLGHSLGGLIVLDYILRLSPAVDGIIIMAPALNKVGVSLVKIIIGKLLSWIYPRFSLDVGIDPHTSSHYPSIVSAYETDPLRHTQVTARFGEEYFKTAEWVENNCHRLSIPTMILQGDEDAVTPALCTRELFDKLPEIDKLYREYKGAYHDLHHDICEKMVMEDINSWLEKQYQSYLQVK